MSKNNLNLKWVEEFVKCNDESEGKKIDISIIEKAFDNIANELKGEYEKNNMDETIVYRDGEYIRLDNEYAIEFSFNNECEGKFELYRKSGIEEESIEEEYNITVKNEVNKCRVYIVNNGAKGKDNPTLLRELNELTIDNIGVIIGNLLEINSAKRI